MTGTNVSEYDAAIRKLVIVSGFVVLLFASTATLKLPWILGPLLAALYSYLLLASAATIATALRERREGAVTPKASGLGLYAIPVVVELLLAAAAFEARSHVVSLSARLTVVFGILVTASLAGAALGTMTDAFKPRFTARPR